MNGIERRLNTLEAKAGPPGVLLFAGIHTNDPHTEKGRVRIDLFRHNPGGADMIAGVIVNSETEALAWLTGKLRGHRSPVTVFYLEGGGYTPDGKAWNYPELTKKCRILPGGKIQ
jgi:hypothetical protein